MFGLPGGAEWIIILVVALLIFGRRLPDVARSVGKSIVEFKRGINDVKDDVDRQSKQSDSQKQLTDRPPPGEAPAASEATPVQHEK